MEQLTLTPEEIRVLTCLVEGKFNGTEPGVILDLCRHGLVTHDDGKTISITDAGREALWNSDVPQFIEESPALDSKCGRQSG